MESEKIVQELNTVIEYVTTSFTYLERNIDTTKNIILTTQQMVMDLKKSLQIEKNDSQLQWKHIGRLGNHNGELEELCKLFSTVFEQYETLLKAFQTNQQKKNISDQINSLLDKLRELLAFVREKLENNSQKETDSMQNRYFGLLFNAEPAFFHFAQTGVPLLQRTIDRVYREFLNNLLSPQKKNNPKNAKKIAQLEERLAKVLRIRPLLIPNTDLLIGILRYMLQSNNKIFQNSIEDMMKVLSQILGNSFPNDIEQLYVAWKQKTRMN